MKEDKELRLLSPVAQHININFSIFWLNLIMRGRSWWVSHWEELRRIVLEHSRLIHYGLMTQWQWSEIISAPSCDWLEPQTKKNNQSLSPWEGSVWLDPDMTLTSKKLVAGDLYNNRPQYPIQKIESTALKNL